VDREESLRRITESLGQQRQMIETIWVHESQAAIERLKLADVDVALIDIGLPSAGGQSILQEVKQRGIEVPIIILTDETDDATVRRLLQLGAEDYLPWSLISPETLIHSLHHAMQSCALAQRLQSIEDQLRSRSALDPHTGLSTPQRIEAILAGEHERARRHGRPLSVAALSIRGWKRIRASLTPQRSDDCLQMVGHLIASQARQADCLAQIEEAVFAAVLPETPAEGGHLMVQRLADQLSHFTAMGRKLDVPLHLAAGLCDLSSTPTVTDGTQLLARAREALLEADTIGDDCMVIWGAA
jgi:diguanylate cyclase (GGDEF)-like protein